MYYNYKKGDFVNYKKTNSIFSEYKNITWKIFWLSFSFTLVLITLFIPVIMQNSHSGLGTTLLIVWLIGLFSLMIINAVYCVFSFRIFYRNKEISKKSSLIRLLIATWIGILLPPVSLVSSFLFFNKVKKMIV
jgi:hypothetical protein